MLKLCGECNLPRVILIKIHRSYDIKGDDGEEYLVCKLCLDWLLEAFNNE